MTSNHSSHWSCFDVYLLDLLYTHGRVKPCWHVYMWPVVSVCDSRTLWDITGSTADGKRGSVVSAAKYVTASGFIKGGRQIFFYAKVKYVYAILHFDCRVSLRSSSTVRRSWPSAAPGASWQWVSCLCFTHKTSLVYAMQTCSISFPVCLSQFHNKVTCFMLHQIEEPCSLGAHAGVIVPPSWIIKVRKPQVRFYQHLMKWGLCNVLQGTLIQSDTRLCSEAGLYALVFFCWSSSA